MKLDINELPCAFVRLNAEARIVEANEIFELWLHGDSGKAGGGPGGGSVGLPIESFMTKSAQIFFRTHVLNHIFLHGGVEEIYLTLLTKNSDELAEVHCLLNAQKRSLDGGTIFIDCVLIKMLVRQDFESELRSARLAATETSIALSAANTQLQSALMDLAQLKRDRDGAQSG